MRISDMRKTVTLTGDELVPIVDPNVPELSGQNAVANVRLFRGLRGKRGFRGLSNYEIWLNQGNQGTEQTFLDEQKGKDGEDGEDGSNGRSAYQIWLDNGNRGEEKDFLGSLKGKSSYQSWLDSGNKGDEAEFVKSLKGKSAYQSWLDSGNKGTESQFVESLKGKSAYQSWLDAGNQGDEPAFVKDLKGERGTIWFNTSAPPEPEDIRAGDYELDAQTGDVSVYDSDKAKQPLMNIKGPPGKDANNGGEIGDVIIGTSTQPKVGRISISGLVLVRLHYPHLWDHARESGMIVDDETWHNGFHGCWSYGDGATTFRSPLAEHNENEFIAVWGRTETTKPGQRREDSFKSHTHKYLDAAFSESNGDTGADNENPRIFGTGAASDNDNLFLYRDKDGVLLNTKTDENNSPITFATGGSVTRPRGISLPHFIVAYPKDFVPESQPFSHPMYTSLRISQQPASDSKSANTFSSSRSLETIVEYTIVGGNPPYTVAISPPSQSRDTGLEVSESNFTLAASGDRKSITFTSSQQQGNSSDRDVTYTANVTDSVGNVSSVNGRVLHSYTGTEPEDAVPAAYDFQDISTANNVGSVNTNQVTLTGFNRAITMTVDPNTNQLYEGIVVNGTFRSGTTTQVSPNDVVSISFATNSQERRSFVTYVDIGGVKDEFVYEVVPAFVEDVSPDPFDFIDTSGRDSSTVTNTVVLSGFNVPLTMTYENQDGTVITNMVGWIFNGVRINGTTGPGGNTNSIEVRSGDTVAIVHTNDNDGVNPDKVFNYKVTLGNYQDTARYTIITADVTPNTFNFLDITTERGNPPIVKTNTITVSGIDEPVGIQISPNGTQNNNFRGMVKNGIFMSGVNTETVTNGDTIAFEFSTTGTSNNVTSTVIIGDGRDDFRLTITEPAPTPFAVQLTPTSIDKSGSNTISSTITITPTGGVPPYTTVLYINQGWTVDKTGPQTVQSGQSVVYTVTTTSNSTANVIGNFVIDAWDSTSDGNNPMFTSDYPAVHRHTVASSGGGGGGGGGGCVTTDMYLTDTLRAGDAKVGDNILVWIYEEDKYAMQPIKAIRFSYQNCYRLTTETGHVLECSDTTPFTMKDGSAVYTVDMHNREVLVERSKLVSGTRKDNWEWSKVTSVESVGIKLVALINVDDQCLAAGPYGELRMFSHNATEQKD